jgi:hypothetical protein
MVEACSTHGRDDKGIKRFGRKPERRDYSKILGVYEKKVKDKVVPVLPLTEHHAMKAYWGSGSTAPPIL